MVEQASVSHERKGAKLFLRTKKFGAKSLHEVSELNRTDLLV